MFLQSISCTICAESLASNSYILNDNEVEIMRFALGIPLESIENHKLCQVCEYSFTAVKNGFKELKERLPRTKAETSSSNASPPHDKLKIHFLDDPFTHSYIASSSLNAHSFVSHFVCLKRESPLALSGSLTQFHSKETFLIILKDSTELTLWTSSAIESLKHSLMLSSPQHHYCLPCSLSFESADVLCEHYKDIHNSSGGGGLVQLVEGSCEICESTFSTNKKKAKESFKCEICSKEFTRKASLQEHTQRHSGTKDRECPICSKRFYATSFWRHLSTVHPAENKLRFKCASCPKTFSQGYKLRIHERTHLPYDERPFLCEECPGKRFASLIRLKSHMKNMHGGGGGVDGRLCPDCGIRVESSSALLAHQSAEHEDRKIRRKDHLPGEPDGGARKQILSDNGKLSSRFVKGVTETGFFEINNTENSSCLPPEPNPQPSFPKAPARTEENEEPMSSEDSFKSLQPCQHCDRAFKTQKALRLHERKFHFNDKDKSCATCNARFTCLSHLKDHERTLHSEDKPFECSVCQKRFRAKRDLTRHFRTHTGEKPYKCLDCDRRFSSPSNLSEHRTLHTGRLPYTCDLCEKKFRLWSSLSKHKRRIHPILNKENETKPLPS